LIATHSDDGAAHHGDCARSAEPERESCPAKQWSQQNRAKERELHSEPHLATCVHHDLSGTDEVLRNGQPRVGCSVCCATNQPSWRMIESPSGTSQKANLKGPLHVRGAPLTPSRIPATVGRRLSLLATSIRPRGSCCAC